MFSLVWANVWRAFLFHSPCLPDAFFGVVDFLELFFSCLPHVLAQGGHTVGMVLQGQAAVGGAQFLFGGVGADLQYLVGFVQGVAAQVQQGFGLADGEADAYGHFFQRLHFFGTDVAVAPGNFSQETEQLQALLVAEVGGYLGAAFVDGATEGLGILAVHALAFLEEVEQDLLPLVHGLFAEVMAEKAAHVFHLAVHDASVRADDVRGHYEHGEEEAVAVARIGRVLRLAIVSASRVRGG